jgi:tetratricopeptide (TPR) repeat protein
MGHFDTVTSRAVIMSVSTLAGIAAFGWMVATYQPSVLQLQREAEADQDLLRDVSRYRRLAQSEAYDLNFDKAIDHQTRIVELQPYEPDNWTDLAGFREQAGQPAKALDARRRAAEIQLQLARDNDRDADEWVEAAYLLRAAGRLEEAETTYRRAADAYLAEARHHDNGTRGWSRAATILSDLGEANRARDAWLGAAEAAERELKSMYAPRSRTDAAFWRSAGDYYLLAGEPDRAKRIYRDAVAALGMVANRPTGANVPRNESEWDLLIWSAYQLGWVRKRLGEEVKAQEAWQRSLWLIEAMVNMPERRAGREWYNRACLRALTGDHEGAFEALERAVRLKQVSRRHMLADEDLRSLVDDDRFQALAAMLDDDPRERPWR